MAGLNVFLKKCIPPILIDLYKRWFRKNNNLFVGNYSSWDKAVENSMGYDDQAIFEKVHVAALKVKHGLAAFERDSVIFEKPDYRWPLLASLLYVANQQKQLRILDFGGALGSLYFQHKSWFKNLDEFYWSVVEQEHFVASGIKEFEENHLTFFLNIDRCIEQIGLPDVAIFSSVLQYLESPYEKLHEVAGKNIPYLIFDRTAFINKKKNRLTVQNVPREIYEASYPAWFFAEVPFIKQIEAMGYVLISEFSCDDHVNHWSYFKGFLFKREGA